MPGDYVIMEPGTRHYSRTEEGCLVLGIDWQRTEDPGCRGPLSVPRKNDRSSK